MDRSPVILLRLARHTGDPDITRLFQRQSDLGEFLRRQSLSNFLQEMLLSGLLAGQLREDRSILPECSHVLKPSAFKFLEEQAAASVERINNSKTRTQISSATLIN